MAEDDADTPIPTSPIGERTLTELLFLLRRPFPPATYRSREVGDRLERYTPIAAVIDRLNRAAGTWNFRIVGATLEDGPGPLAARSADGLVCIIVGELMIPGLCARQAQGMALWEDSADPLLHAGAEALRHAAALFGVPLIERSTSPSDRASRRAARPGILEAHARRLSKRR
jgi:hypothetical protein